MLRALIVPLAAFALVLSACGSDDETPVTTTTTEAAPAPETTTTTTGAIDQEIQVEVRDGEVVGGSKTVPVKVGARVRLEVIADVNDDVHVHGYDLFVAISPPEPAVLVFEADIPGVFEVELEDAGLTLVELEVS